MSILIHNMRMPNNCLNCKFSYMNSNCMKVWIVCKVIDKTIKDSDVAKDGRPDYCPLVEVKNDPDSVEIAHVGYTAEQCGYEK